MKTVKCINDEFKEQSFSSDEYKAILKVGEELPQKGKLYTVISEYHDGGVAGYKLAELDYSAYKIKLYFNAERFEVVENKFTPNSIDDNGHLIEKQEWVVKTEIKF